MIPKALFIIAVWMITGMGLGMLSTGYGVCRTTYHLFRGLQGVFDWLWFLLAGVAFVAMLFWTEWGVFRIWSVVFVLVGYGLWAWLAAPLVMEVLLVIGHAEARALHWTLTPGRRLTRWVIHRMQDQKKPSKKG